MKLKVLGFGWSPQGAIDTQELRRILDERSAVSISNAALAIANTPPTGWDEIIFALTNRKHEKNDFWVGIVIRVRDHKTMQRVASKNGKLRVTAEELENGSRLVDSNLFIYKPASGRGLYQYYFHSTWPERFAQMCKNWVDADVDKRHRARIAELRSAGFSKAEARKAANGLLGSLESELIFRSEDYEKILTGLKKVNKVSIRLRDDDVKITDLGLLKEHANRTLIELRIEKDSPIKAVRRGIISAVENLNPWRVRVEGVNNSDKPEIFSLSHNIESFNEADFDEVMKDGLDIDLSDPIKSLTASPIMDRLLALTQTDRVKAMLK